ncbi:hypothetical protein ALC62_14269 [Cyphomyrmex costatus]|uniref:MADF domain-containing protein n=1 Tax=Cyphomyrmex costatus TaxID=456900 RepID=A0A151I8W0_9HYME|nr:hypothetical protein ALC62_14269 [Cyphomyrmex costatus]
MEINETINRDIKLITLVERFPHLYDKSSAKYKDRTAVDNSWLFISGDRLVVYYILRDIIVCNSDRWTSLRNRFSKERAKNTPSGSAAQTEWPLIKYLTFLHSVVRKRRIFGNVRMTNNPSNIDYSNLSLENFPESQYFEAVQATIQA